MCLRYSPPRVYYPPHIYALIEQAHRAAALQAQLALPSRPVISDDAAPPTSKPCLGDDAAPAVTPVTTVAAAPSRLSFDELTDRCRYDSTVRYKPSVDFEDEGILLAFHDNTQSSPEELKIIEKINKLPARDGSFKVMNADGKVSDIILSKADVDHLKTVRFREKYLLDKYNLRLDSTSIADRQKILRFMSVCPNTFRGYASHWNVLRANHCNIDLTDDGLGKLFALNRGRYSNASLVHWIAAVKLHMNVFNTPSAHFTAEDRIRTLAKGYQHDNTNGIAKERGVINRAKLEDMIACEHCPPLYRQGFQLQFACGLRTNQMSAIHVSEFHPVQDQKNKSIIGYVYACPKHKDSKSHVRKAIEYHICDPTYLPLITSMIEAARNTNGFLIPEWNSTQALAIVKKCASSLGWNPDLEWVNHGIRHGACLDAADSAEDQSVAGRALAAQTRGAQNSLNVINNTYLRKDDVRSIVASACKNHLGNWHVITVDGFTIKRNKKSYTVTKSDAAAVVPSKNRRQTAVRVSQAAKKRAKSEAGEITLQGSLAKACALAKTAKSKNNKKSKEKN